MTDIFQEIDSVKLNFSEGGGMILNITIALIMFGVALELKVDDFKQLFSKPKPAFVGIASQFVLMPLATFILVLAINSFISPTIGLGMILVASCPGGNISNFISSLARGNVALSVSLTAFSSVGAIFLTPFNFTFWGGLYMKYLESAGNSELVRNLEVDAVGVLLTILTILGIPLVLGITFNTKFPKLSDKITVWMKRFSIFAFASIMVIIFAGNFDLFTKYIQYIFIIVLIHNAVALSVGYFSAKAMRLDKRDCKTIAIETGIQNSALALALLFNPKIFPQDQPMGGMAFIAAWWGVWHILSGLTIAGVWSGFSLKSNREFEATKAI